MKPLEIVEKIKAANPEAFGKVNDKIAAKIIKLGLAEVAKQLVETEEGEIRIAGLGNFKINNVEREKDGVKTTVKRISLRVRSVNDKEDI